MSPVSSHESVSSSSLSSEPGASTACPPVLLRVCWRWEEEADSSDVACSSSASRSAGRERWGCVPGRVLRGMLDGRRLGLEKGGILGDDGAV